MNVKPELPKDLGDRSKNFIQLCQEKYRYRRPSCSMLLDHEFIKEGVTKIPMMKMLETYQETKMRCEERLLIEMRIFNAPDLEIR